jgi:hypothetical protein
MNLEMTKISECAQNNKLKFNEHNSKVTHMPRRNKGGRNILK